MRKFVNICPHVINTPPPCFATHEIVRGGGGGVWNESNGILYFVFAGHAHYNPTHSSYTFTSNSQNSTVFFKDKNVPHSNASKEINKYIVPLSIVAYSSLPFKNIYKKKLCSPQSAIPKNSAFKKKNSLFI